MTGLKAGQALDFWEGEEVRAGFYLGEEKGKLRVVSSAGKELKVPEARVANQGGVAADPHAPAAALAVTRDLRGHGAAADPALDPGGGAPLEIEELLRARRRGGQEHERDDGERAHIAGMLHPACRLS